MADPARQCWRRAAARPAKTVGKTVLSRARCRRLRERAGHRHHQLRNQTGLITLDPGFGNRAPASSAITFIDGERGILRYRGIRSRAGGAEHISSRWRGCSCTASCPTRGGGASFSDSVTQHTMLHGRRTASSTSLPKDAIPCGVRRCGGACDVLSAAENGRASRSGDAPAREDADDRGVLVQTLASASRSCIRERRSTYCANFLHMMFATPCEEYGRSGLAKASTCSSSCTPITSRTARRSPCASSAARARTSSPASRPVSARSGARSTAAPTKR
jgi:hypothetical protein